MATSTAGWLQGCEHYKRNCKIVAPCCNNVYSCRFCHDQEEDHTLNRRAVSEVMCTKCLQKQPVSKSCKKCGAVFGKYACLICKLYDNEHKGQFHCNNCGLCRIGGKENYFHCKKCDLCLALRLFGNHECIEKASRSDCPVCVEYLHTSTKFVHVPKCGHLLHEACFQTLKTTGQVSCVICRARY